MRYVWVSCITLCAALSGCVPERDDSSQQPQVLVAGSDAWGPLVRLRDDTEAWPEQKPAHGWWVTPIHATLLPNGNVLATGWGRTDPSNCAAGGTRLNGLTFLLDPSALPDSVLNVVPIDEQGEPASDVLYCAGHAPLADGRILFAGGSRYENLGEQNEIELGLDYARLFEPSEIRFVRVEETMAGGPTGQEGIRWYPTVTRLADSRALVTGGFTRYGSRRFVNLSIELFDYKDHDRGEPPWELLVSHEEGPKALAPGLLDYTHVYLLPRPVRNSRGVNLDRQVAMIGRAGKVLLLNYTDDFAADERFVTPRNGARAGRANGSTGALVATGEIMVMGGTQDPRVGQRADFYDPAADAWESVNTEIGRYHGASVLLPDGTVLLINGESRKQFTGDTRRPQILDPDRRSVATLPPWPDDARQRGYHSFAILLKDARVLVGGGIDSTDYRVGCERPDVRIYSPPYLLSGPRPTIDNLTEPLRITTGGSAVTVQYSGGPLRSEDGIVLMALGSTTHAFDQNQRYVPLEFQIVEPGMARLTPPPDHFVAPPGDYLLFVVSHLGVPSEGKHVRLQ